MPPSQVLRDEVPQTLKFRLTEQESPDSGLMCGGEVTLFVEPITAPLLWVFGGGHVSKALCRVASMAGFRVTVVDDRPAYASAERFPEAVEAFPSPLVEAVDRMPLQSNSYAIVVTRGHKEDGVVLQALADRWAKGQRGRFVGMIGSRTKQKLLFKHLREAGVEEGFLDAVRTPVGLHIGARSHDEIAVSIVAELVSVRRLGQDGAAAWEARRQARGAAARPRPLDGSAG